MGTGPFAHRKCELTAMGRQVTGTARVQGAEPEAGPGAELIAVAEAFRHSEAGLV